MKKNFTLSVKQSMLRLSLALGLFVATLSASAADVNVTFKVDMTGVDVSNGVYITGELNSWVFTSMAQEGTTAVYSVTLSLTSGNQYIYYFRNKGVWDAANRETVPTACALSSTKTGGWAGDRLITVPDADATVGIMYGGCDPVGSVKIMHNITFRVDMNGVDVSNGVFITGALNGWAFTQLVQEGTTTIYSTTLSLEEGKSFAYYFLNLNNWDATSRETVPAECAMSAPDRLITVPTADATIGTIYASCNAIGTVTGVNAPEAISVLLYPNPVNDILNITLPVSASTYDVVIASVTGSVVKAVSCVEGGQILPVGLSDCAKGLYLVTVTGTNGSITQKINVK